LVGGVFFRAWSLAFLSALFIGDASPQNQPTTKRPVVGVALFTRDGAPAAVGAGCLKALEELNVPVDSIAGVNTGALVAALYATGHSYQQISDEIGELGDLYSDQYLTSPTYGSDFGLRRFLALQFGRFDLVANNDFTTLPIPFLTSALELVSGKQYVFTNGSLADAIRASMSSPLFLEPIREQGLVFVSGTAGPGALLRAKGGADVVIAVFDQSSQTPYQPNEWSPSSRAVVMESVVETAYRGQFMEDLQYADVLIPVDTHEFSSGSTGSIGTLINVGYQSVMKKKKLLESFAIDREGILHKRSAVTEYYQKQLTIVDNAVLTSIGVQGNHYTPQSTIIAAAGLKPGVRFDIQTVIEAADRVYSTGYFSSCWPQLKRLNHDDVSVTLNVKESEFLPISVLPDLLNSLRSLQPAERRFAAVALSNIGPKAKEAIPQLVALLSDDSSVVRSAAVRALGSIGPEARDTLPQILSLLKRDSDVSIKKDAAWALSRIAISLRTTDDVRQIATLQESLEVLSESMQLAEYGDSVKLSLKFLKEIQDSRSTVSFYELAHQDGTAPTWANTEGEVYLNGEPVRIELSADRSGVRFLGSETESLLRQGVNRITRGGQQATFWLEGRKLLAYENPYKNSYAVIVAIDDYDHKGDPLHRPPTGYPSLTGMVSNAENLSEILQKLGFPKNNIVTLFDKQASSEAVDNALKSFWPGGKYSQADRVLFYFGGHGDKYGLVPYLVTYDFDRSKPTLTSTLMKDLTDRQSQNILANHVLFALDACDSGLTVKSLGDSQGTEQQVRRFHSLSVVRRDTEHVARNVLVAGTGDQRALWQNGGIFTKALLDGLNGEADLNQDGLIEFEELGLYIRDRVTAQAAMTGVRQDPDFRVLNQYGDGRVVFVKPTP
jgi:predicted acylesterase/phospholipase RssA